MQNLTALAGVVLSALLMTGCAAQDPTARPTPRPTSTPVFASDDEALAAAEAAYAEYLKVSDAISADGGANPDRIAPFVTPERFADETEVFSELQDEGLTISGATTFDSMSVQQHDHTVIETYVCLDVSTVVVLDHSGVDVTPTDRTNRIPLAVSFEIDLGTGKLPISASNVWDGDNFCAD